MSGAIKIPEISFRQLMRGIVATNVLVGMTVAISFCVVFLVAVLAFGFLHPSIFKLLRAFFLLFSIIISYSLNVMFVGWWCFKGLFGSANRQLVVTIVLAGWLTLLLYYTEATTYSDIAFPLVLFVLTGTEKIQEWRVQS
jgi:hypothetical protein